jgi:geranylgeranylglycerol-phosphate geranylgeranyltransferase
MVSAIIKMARPANGVLAFMAVWLGAFVGSKDLSAHIPALMAFSASTVLILSAGNGINDIFGLRIDLVNRPNRPLPCGKLSVKYAAVAFTVMMAAGMGLASAAGKLPALIALFAGLSLFFYSIKLKAIPLAGNMVVGVLTSLTFISGGVIVGNSGEAMVPATFAFLFTVSREIFKDIQDIPGDGAAGICTAPLAWGAKKAWNLASAFLLAGVIYSPVPCLMNNYNLLYLGIMLLGVDGILLWSLGSLGKKPCLENAGKMQRILKYDILIGFMAIFLGRL